MKNNENDIEFLTGEKTMTVTFTSQKYVNKIRKLHERFPDDFVYFIENNDGSICAKIPLKWLKLSNVTRELTEEQREAARERFTRMRKNKE